MKRKKTIAFAFYLPDECWESVFKFLNDGYADGNNNHHYLEPLSLVSKQFLSITNRLIFSLTMCDQEYHHLSHLFHRFTNLASLDFSGYIGDLNRLLCEISHFPLNLKSLNLSNQLTIPTNGLRAFSRNNTTLTSLTCSRINTLRSLDMFLFAGCFPLLEELDLSNPSVFMDRNNFLKGIETFSFSLLKLRKVNLSSHDYMNDQSLLNLFKNWKLLEEANILYCRQITMAGIASALLERQSLRSLSFTSYFESDNGSKLFALVRHCPSLSEIRMTYEYIGDNNVENSNSLTNFVGSPQFKSLHLPRNLWLTDESIIMFATIFPNLQLLDLRNCYKISEEGICVVLKGCSNIRYLNLNCCSRVKLHRLNFEVPKLEVLNLSDTRVDDESLYVISKSCRGLLELLLKYCQYVSEKGVRHVLENCTHLREINLEGCFKVCCNFVPSMVITRPSLIKIIAPPSERKRKLFLHHGCLVC